MTAREAPWLSADLEFAASHGIVATPRRWADLRASVAGLLDDGLEEGLSSRLVGEFFEMLTEEGLIPLEPLSSAETGTAWDDSWNLLRRYREFFHACKTEIGEALGAVPITASNSDRGDWFWQDY